MMDRTRKVRVYSLNTNTFTFSLDILKDPGCKPRQVPGFRKKLIPHIKYQPAGKFLLFQNFQSFWPLFILVFP
jgi:hypothetical protein